MEREKAMISYEDALNQILGVVSVQTKTTVLSLDDANGEVIADAVIAPFDLPRFNNSAVDGYGFCSENFATISKNNPLQIDQFSTIPAGEAVSGDFPIIKIMTGAAIPQGIDAVVKREEIEQEDGRLILARPPKKGENVRFAGEEVKKNTQLLSAHTLITPSVIGLLATLGYASARVIQRPIVAVYTTGNEVLDSKNELKDTHIYNANLPALMAALNQQKCTIQTAQHLKDDPHQIRSALQQALNSVDIILTTGGVSMGDYDYVRTIALELGVQELFWKIAIKPGKPVFFGIYPKEKSPTLFFGLPGNPVAALVTYETLVLPALRKMVGLPPYPSNLLSGKLTNTIRKKEGRMEFLRAQAVWNETGYLVTPLAAQESHMLSGLAQANALAFFPRESSAIQEGENIFFRWIEGV